MTDERVSVREAIVATALAVAWFVVLLVVLRSVAGVHSHNALRKHGAGLAFVGLALGPPALFFGQRRFRPEGKGVVLGRWIAARAMGPLLVLAGLVGVAMVVLSY